MFHLEEPKKSQKKSALNNVKSDFSKIIFEKAHITKLPVLVYFLKQFLVNPIRFRI